MNLFHCKQIAVEYNVVENDTKPAISMTVNTDTAGDSVLITVCMR